jgi:hypothetical protein
MGMKNEEEDVAKLAIEFWCTVCEEEIAIEDDNAAVCPAIYFYVVSMADSGNRHKPKAQLRSAHFSAFRASPAVRWSLSSLN